MAKHPSRKLIFKTSLILLTLLIIAVVSFFTYFQNRFYPGTSVAGVSLTGLTRQQAIAKITQTIAVRASHPIFYTYQNNNYNLDLSNKYQLDLTAALDQAFRFGHQELFFPPPQLPAGISLSDNFSAPLQPLASQIYTPPIESQLKIDGQDISVTPSQTGLALDQAALSKQIIDYLDTGRQTTHLLPITTTYPRLSYTSALAIKQTLDAIKLTPLKLVYNDTTFTLDLTTLANLIDYQSSTPSLITAKNSSLGFNIRTLTIDQNTLTDNKIALDPDKLSTYLATLAKSIDRPVQEPLFQFDGQKVTEFKPPVIGQTLDRTKTAALITYALQSRDFTPIDLPVNQQQPTNKLSNDLGITELIGSGQSDFSHSIENRIFNIKLAASRINGVLIPPGEEFSFVKYIGNIDAGSGYRQAYVIKEGRTVLDDGGGVCQVSTTVFRAALNTGLPITARTAHAYRVGYYENDSPPGLDATIYSPSVDLRFKNDTGHHILIQTQVSGTKLFVNVYGTSDGRVATVSRPVILSQTPPLPEIRQDDPTLPRGTVKQVDWAAWGANVIFTRKVTKNGQLIINDTFRSNYRPWQAVYLVGTKDG